VFFPEDASLEIDIGLRSACWLFGNYLYADFEAITTIYCIVEGIILPLSCKLISNHVSLM
jgi:hypothetical protein